MSIELQTKPPEIGSVEGPVQLPPTVERFTLMELWRVMMKRRFVILVVTLISVAGAVWYALRTTPVYESEAHVEIRTEDSPNLGIQQILGQDQGGGDFSSPIQTELRILVSDTVLFETAKSLNFLDEVRSGERADAVKHHQTFVPSPTITPVERDNMIGMIRDGLTATVLTGTQIVEIRYRNEDPKVAATVVNKLIDTYSDENLRSRYDRTMHISTWLQKQLDGLRTEASDAQRELAEYQKAHNIVGTDQSSTLAVQSLEDISGSLDQAEADRITKEARLRDFNSLSPTLVAMMGDNPDAQTLRSQLTDLQAQRAQLSARYGPKYPRIVDLTAQINKVQGQIDAEVTLARSQIQSEYQGSLHQEEALRQRLNSQEDALFKLNAGGAQYAVLTNQAELTIELYDTLQMRLKEATVTAGLSADTIRVVDSAAVPYIPVAPRKKQSVILGLLGGLILGCALGFLLESIDDRLQTSDEVEAATMLPTLAAIPHLASEADSRKFWKRKEVNLTASRRNQQLIALRDSKSVCAEAYRNLRSSLLLSSIDNPPRIIVVTSALPEEGKSTTSINTAIVLAQRGEKVLLVDGDLRRGTLGAVFGLSERRFGLSTVLASPESHLEIPAPLPELPTLHVLVTGPRPPNPAEMLSSSRMEEQFRQWLDEYDRIVIDSAPLLAVSDTQGIAVYADTVLLVTRAGVTRRRALLRARDVLLRIKAPVAGVVVNDVEMRLENFYTHRYGLYGYGDGGRYGSPSSDRAYGYDEEQDEKE